MPARLSMILLLLSALAFPHDLPMSFEPCLDVNCGAAKGKVQFLARGSAFNLFLAPTEAALDLRIPRLSRVREEMRLPVLFREALELPPLGHRRGAHEAAWRQVERSGGGS